MNSADSITMSDNHEKTALAVALGDENWVEELAGGGEKKKKK